MNASESTFKLPSVIAKHTGYDTALDPLEPLRSPQTFGQKSFPSERDSIARSEFNDIALDDDSYFPVPLTAQPGIPESYPHQPPDEDDITAVSRSRVPSLSLTLQDLRLSIPSKSHRKTASTTTIRSTHEPESNGPSLVTRLDFQEHKEKVARASVDGQMKLQEEFARLQEMETKDHNQTESSIDWGEYFFLRKTPYHLIPPRILGGGYIWCVHQWHAYFSS